MAGRGGRPTFRTQTIRRRQAARRRFRGTTRVYKKTQIDFNALAASGDISGTILDRSAVSGSSNLRSFFPKIKISMFNRAMTDAARTMLMAVIRDEESLGAAGHALDAVEVVEDLADQKKLLRGPFAIQVGLLSESGVYDAMYKTIVLKNVELKSDQDLYAVYTNIDGNPYSANSHLIDHVVTGAHKIAV